MKCIFYRTEMFYFLYSFIYFFDKTPSVHGKTYLLEYKSIFWKTIWTSRCFEKKSSIFASLAKKDENNFVRKVSSSIPAQPIKVKRNYSVELEEGGNCSVSFSVTKFLHNFSNFKIPSASKSFQLQDGLLQSIKHF